MLWGKPPKKMMQLQERMERRESATLEKKDLEARANFELNPKPECRLTNMGSTVAQLPPPKFRLGQSVHHFWAK